MSSNDAGAPGDFETLARKYWNAWGETLRQASGETAPGQPEAATGAADRPAGWQQALEWWNTLVSGVRQGQGPAPDVATVLERFNRQAGEWFGTMQEVAAQFAGRDATPADVAGAWRKALGDKADHLFRHVFETMRGPGLQGMDAWLADMARHLEHWRDESAPWLQAPALGAAREHQARWQVLVRAQQDYQQQSQAYAELMNGAVKRAFELFEKKLAERQQPGHQLTSARALFDTWVDAAEEAYADVAMSGEFQRIYADLTAAQMRLRAAMQQEVEQLSTTLGMPTRTEVDAAHRKIADLERSVRRLQQALKAATSAAAGAAPATAATPAKKTAARKSAPAAKKASVRTTATAAPGQATPANPRKPRP